MAQPFKKFKSTHTKKYMVVGLNISKQETNAYKVVMSIAFMLVTPFLRSVELPGWGLTHIMKA